MKAKALTLSTIIFALITLVVAIFAYQFYIAPSFANNVDHTKKIPFKQHDFAFGKGEDQEDIYSLELEISGKAKDNFELLIGSEKNVFEQRVLVKKNSNVDFVHVCDWYTDSCYLQIRPKTPSEDSLEVICRFISMH